MKTMEQIESEARIVTADIPDFIGDEASVAYHDGHRDGFKMGAQWIQKDLLESAPKGYSKYEMIKAYNFNGGNLTGMINDSLENHLYETGKRLWQACDMKNQKIISDEIEYSLSLKRQLNEKDQKIAELERSIETLDRGIKVAISQERDFQNELQDKYDQAVKDIKYLCDNFSTLLLLGETKNNHKDRVQEIRKRHGISEE